MRKKRLKFQTECSVQDAFVFQKDNLPNNPKRLLLVHGAGIGGELTWSFVTHYLNAWDVILVPDIAGMGKSRFHSNEQPKLTDYHTQLDELIDTVAWPTYDFDVAGYSFGGMLVESWLRGTAFNNLCFLLEPAMLISDTKEDLLNKAAGYAEVAQMILANPNNSDAYVLFLNSVSPKRKDDIKNEQLIIKRLQANPIGFAQTLLAITEKLESDHKYYVNWRSPWQGASFVGELSWSSMHRRHHQLAQQSECWCYEVVAGADHSLVFTRPRTIAKVMNEIKNEVQN